MDLAIGIEIGGTKLQVVAGPDEGHVLGASRGAVDLERGPAGIRDALDRLADEALSAAGARGRRPAAVGIGFGGPVDSKAGRVICSHQVPGWSGFELGKWAEERWGAPSVVQNDASTAAWGEWRLGAGRGCDRLFYITIGSGIGGGWVCDGKLDEGQGLGASEIGHTWVASPRGGYDKLENISSGWSIGRRATEALAQDGRESKLRGAAEANGGRVTARDVSDAAEAGDALALEIMDVTTDALAAAIGNVVALLNPRRIVIGGGVSLMGDCLWKPLREKAAARGYAPFAGTYDIVPAGLGEAVVTRGALSLAFARLSSGISAGQRA